MTKFAPRPKRENHHVVQRDLASIVANPAPRDKRNTYQLEQLGPPSAKILEEDELEEDELEEDELEEDELEDTYS